MQSTAQDHRTSWQAPGNALTLKKSFQGEVALHTNHELHQASRWVQESVLSIGWVIGPVVGGYGAQLGGFGAPFFITAGLAFVCYPLLLWLTPKGRPPVLAAWACLLSGAPQCSSILPS